MRCIVTGGAGFIGSHLAELLVHHGYDVVVLDNFSTGRRENLGHLANKITIVECDLSVESDWQKQFIGVDYVFHLAALADIVPSIQNPAAYFESNVVGTFNVLTAARSNNVKRFIYSASSSCYGIPNIFPTPEIADINPQYPYALTKRLGEELVLHWAQIYDFPATSLRLFNVYGPRSRTSGTYGAVFGVFLAQKLAGKPLTIVGDGLQTRDFTYVTDVVDAMYAAALSLTKGEVFNVGSGTTISVNTLAKLLGGETVHIPKRPGEPDCTFADIKKIKYVLGWQPKISISNGVESLLKNISYWKNAPVWTPESINVATADWFKYLSEK
jgi:UDP-glucose 4-epimerase